MHHINYFWVNLGTAYVGQYISVTDIAFCMILIIFPPVVYVLKWWPPSQPKNRQRHSISYLLKHKHLKKTFFCEKINGSVGWNQHSGEQH